MSQYDQGHSFGVAATERPMAVDCAMPSSAASRTQVPVSSSTARSVSATRTPHPKATKAGSTRFSTRKL